MKFQVGDLFVYQDSRSTATLLLTKIDEYRTLHLEFSDEEGVRVIGQYNIDLMERDYLKNGCWKHFPVKT